MYGLINNALKEFVTEQLGEAKWDEICDKDSLPKDYNNLASYDDDIIAKIVGSICESEKLEATQLLIAFGEFWIKFAQKSEYEGILSTFSDNPFFLIKSLDSLHTRLAITFDNLEPPTFWVSEETENSALVHYSSKRSLPLEYFVEGLILGIFKMFDRKCEVEILQFRSEDQEAILRVQEA